MFRLLDVAVLLCDAQLFGGRTRCPQASPQLHGNPGALSTDTSFTAPLQHATPPHTTSLHRCLTSLKENGILYGSVAAVGAVGRWGLVRIAGPAR